VFLCKRRTTTPISKIWYLGFVFEQSSYFRSKDNQIFVTQNSKEWAVNDGQRLADEELIPVGRVSAWFLYLQGGQGDMNEGQQLKPLLPVGKSKLYK
jgi:hypothetical protein